MVKETANIEDEDARMRLRSALRECVSAIWCVFAGHKTGRYRARLNIMLPGGGWREVTFWADTGHKRSKRKPGAGIVAGGGRGDESAELAPADEPYEPAPVLALEDGAGWATQWRDEQLEVVAGRKTFAEFEAHECGEE